MDVGQFIITWAAISAIVAGTAAAIDALRRRVWWHYAWLTIKVGFLATALLNMMQQ